MHMLHKGHGDALFGREINICNTVITPFTGEGCEAMHATFSTS